MVSEMAQNVSDVGAAAPCGRWRGPAVLPTRTFILRSPPRQQELLISFVEEHLRLHGVEIREHVAITCPCGHKFEEETIRQRIARGDKDVACPVCEKRHSLSETATESRARDPSLIQRTWALKTRGQKSRLTGSKNAVQYKQGAGNADDPTLQPSSPPSQVQTSRRGQPDRCFLFGCPTVPARNRSGSALSRKPAAAHCRTGIPDRTQGKGGAESMNQQARTKDFYANVFIA